MFKRVLLLMKDPPKGESKGKGNLPSKSKFLKKFCCSKARPF